MGSESTVQYSTVHDVHYCIEGIFRNLLGVCVCESVSVSISAEYVKSAQSLNKIVRK